ncbi:hypothetical protein GOODEAATRI_025329 [Goodea atripinnis]|uniref:Uncharacterized protein n=1 Tax=Goodea atripinnis TaxID=208336 RepID=A0ABV0N497_9TELE
MWTACLPTCPATYLPVYLPACLPAPCKYLPKDFTLNILTISTLTLDSWIPFSSPGSWTTPTYYPGQGYTKNKLHLPSTSCVLSLFSSSGLFYFDYFSDS